MPNCVISQYGILHKLITALLVILPNCVISLNVLLLNRVIIMAERKRDMQKQKEWSRAYNNKTYDRLYPFVPKGRKEEIQAAAEKKRGNIKRIYS